MDILNIENKNISISEKRNKGVWLCSPVIAIGGILISLSYIIDVIYTGTAQLGIGETTAVAQTLLGIGKTINKLISPLMSGGIALYIGGLPALAAGLIGGIMTGLGVTLNFSTGNTGAITGIYGSLLAGIVAGYSTWATKMLVKIILKKENNISFYIIPVVSIIATTATVFVLDYSAQIINGLASVTLAATGEVSKLAVVILLSVMITADIGGPLYLASLVYGVASIGTNESEIMAAVTAAGCVPALSFGLAVLIYKDRFKNSERIFAIPTVLCGLCGISQIAIPFYATRLHKAVLPNIVGGVISGVLCRLFNCSSTYVSGGFLSITSADSLLYFFISVLCGVLFSAAIMGYSLSPIENTEYKSNTEDISEIKIAKMPS